MRAPLALAAVFACSGSLHAAEESPVIDSTVWQAHFESWVESRLVRDELEAAVKDMPSFDPQAVVRSLVEIEARHVHGWREPTWLPQDVHPPLLTHGVSGRVLEAVRAYSTGQHEPALELLRSPELAADSSASHVRAQLLDELTRELSPLFRLGVIEAYRRAIRAEGQSALAGRARLRVGQIYLALGFLPEARAQLRPALASLAEPHAGQARVTLAETSLLDGDPNAALEIVDALEPEQLSPEVGTWRERRRADALFALRRYPEAIAAYEKLLDGAPLAAVRHGFALIVEGRPGEAIPILEPALRADPPADVAALGGLVLARALRESRLFEQAVQTASVVPSTRPGSDTAALAAVEALESQRLLGETSLPLPDGAAELVTDAATSAAIGLLSYRAAARPQPDDTPLKAVQRLGSLLATLPTTQIQALAQDDLTARLAEDLARTITSGEPLEPAILDIVERYMRPRRIGENALLVAVENLARAERRETCVRWARTLTHRERRPLRRGLAAWREVRCLGSIQGDRVAGSRLMIHADSGRAGPFALALAALAAETQVRLGDTERAVRTYERALQAFTEPSLLGPVLLRLGELEAATGHDKLALRRLTRGLVLTRTDDLATDPFRKAGLLALSRMAARTGDSKRVNALLREERTRVDPWWNAAYAWLLRRDGSWEAPRGDNLFARVAREAREIEKMKKRVNRAVQERTADGRSARP